MCGITGWVDWNMDLTQYVPVMKKMTASLSKRGPDALKVWGSHNILLGHARLVVVDPKGGLQPMVKVKNGKNITLYIMVNFIIRKTCVKNY